LVKIAKGNTAYQGYGDGPQLEEHGGTTLTKKKHKKGPTDQHKQLDISSTRWCFVLLHSIGFRMLRLSISCHKGEYHFRTCHSMDPTTNTPQ